MAINLGVRAFTISMFWGVISAGVAWLLLVLIYYERSSSLYHKGLVAVSGGWNLLIRLPSTALLLGGAFGIGFWIAGRFR